MIDEIVNTLVENGELLAICRRFTLNHAEDLQQSICEFILTYKDSYYIINLYSNDELIPWIIGVARNKVKANDKFFTDHIGYQYRQVELNDEILNAEDFI